MTRAPAKLRNNITRWIWIIVLVPLTGISIAVGVSSVGAGVYIMLSGIRGDLALPSLPAVPPTWVGVFWLAAIAIPAGVGYLLIRYTYGGQFVDDTVDAGTEDAEQIQDTVGDD